MTNIINFPKPFKTPELTPQQLAFELSHYWVLPEARKSELVTYRLIYWSMDHLIKELGNSRDYLIVSGVLYNINFIDCSLSALQLLAKANPLIQVKLSFRAAKSSYLKHGLTPQVLIKLH